jgi:hypothetical protein
MMLWLLALLAAGQEEAFRPKVYDPDPENLWNRLHRAFFAREDDLDPLLGAVDKDFLEGEAHRTAIAALDDFLSKDGHALFPDPLRRILLQRDLWAVFDLAAWTADEWVHLKKHEAASLALRERLAKAMARLAPTADEFAALPDSLARAAASGEFAADYDPSRPDRLFLPPDLLDPKGPWIRLSDFPPLAKHHTNAVAGRSHFHVLLRLPAGREATLAYLQGFKPESPAVLPPGTRVGLVRRALAIDRAGRIRATPLIESLQFRVFRDPPDVYELKMDRRRLVEGKTGGLRAVGPQEIEAAPLFRVFPFGPDRKRIPREPVLKLCGGCHGNGLFSLADFAKERRGHPLRTYEPDVELGYTLSWKTRRYEWGLLQGWLENLLPAQDR